MGKRISGRERRVLPPLISLNAIAGVPSLMHYKTIRVSGIASEHKLHILVDSSSTHNYVNAFTIQKLGFQVGDCPLVAVMVDDGSRVQCSQICVGMSWRMQGLEFKADFLVIPLEGCQMVLGIQ